MKPRVLRSVSLFADHRPAAAGMAERRACRALDHSQHRILLAGGAAGRLWRRRQAARRGDVVASATTATASACSGSWTRSTATASAARSRSTRNLCAEHPRIIEEGNKRKWEWMGHNESNTRRLNEAPARRRGAHHPPHARDHRQARRPAPDRLAVVRPAGDLGHARSSGRRTASNTSPTGATTISPM